MVTIASSRNFHFFLKLWNITNSNRKPLNINPEKRRKKGEQEGMLINGQRQDQRTNMGGVGEESYHFLVNILFQIGSILCLVAEFKDWRAVELSGKGCRQLRSLWFWEDAAAPIHCSFHSHTYYIVQQLTQTNHCSSVCTLVTKKYCKYKNAM